MKVIKIIGLGPGDPKHISRKAWEILSSSDELLLRTNTHPVFTSKIYYTNSIFQREPKSVIPFTMSEQSS